MRALAIAAALGGVAAHAGVAAADPEPKGIAVGAEAGQPTAGLVGWSTGLIGVEAAVGSGTVGGHGLYLAGDVSVAPIALAHGAKLRVPLYLGVGARRYYDHFHAMSLDEIPDVHTGIEGLVGVGFELASGLEVVVRGGAGWDVARTDSCTLMSGVNSVCPHEQSSRAYWTGVVVARFWLH